MSQKVKRKSRGNGEGSIRQRKDGRWEARITIGRNENGSQKMKYFYGKTRKEAAEKLEAYNSDTRKGIYIEPNKYTVADWLKEWYRNYAVNRVKPTTRRDYEIIINKFIIPYLGYHKLMDLKSGDIQEFYNRLSVEKLKYGKSVLSPARVKSIHKVLRYSLEIAYLNDMIPKNPASGKRVILPKDERKKEVQVFTPDEQRRIENSCMSKRLGTAIILDLYTGMRRGELLALTWDDIDFENQIITINKQLNRLKNFDTTNKLSKTSLVISPYTKTSMGRKVAVSPKIIRLLLQHKKNQELNRNEIGNLYKDENLIFCYEDGRRIDPQYFIKSYTDILKHANVNYIKFHALRHTFATRALEAGIPVKVVSQILGHANIGITLDTYSHVLSELQDKAMQTITDKFLSIEI